MSGSKAILAAGAALAIVMMAAPAQAQQRTFDLPAQPATRSIPEFARQAGIQIIAPGSILRSVRTPALRGTYDVRAALRRLLAESGLRIVSDEGGTITLGPARGSSGPGEDQAADVAAESAGVFSVIEVLGTRIRGIAADYQPVARYERADIERSGAATIADFARRMPENFASEDELTGLAPPASPSVIPGAGGENIYRGSGFNLRGLGAGSTLTLLNGQRLAPSGNAGAFVDTSLIPLSAVERIEVLADGASAIYGADAIAGVVNLVTNPRFNGAETSLRFGGATRGGLEELVFSQTLGGSVGAASGILAYEYGSNSGLTSDLRSFIPPEFSQGTAIPRSLSPERERHSLLGTGRLSLTDSVEIGFNGFYGVRSDRSLDSISVGVGNPNLPPISFRGGVDVEQYGGAMSLVADLSNTWRATTGVEYSVSNQEIERESSDLARLPSNRSSARFEERAVNLMVNGSLFEVGGGSVSLALGASLREQVRQSAFQSTNGVNSSGELDRLLSSGFAELFVPLVESQNSRPLIRRLNLSFATRIDDYSDVGTGATYKIGALWSPVEGLSLRGTYGTSFRAPLLTQLSGSAPTFIILRLSDPSAPDQITNTLLKSAAFNPNLRPETARTISLGLEFNPTFLPGLAVSLSYYDIDYRDRIGSPPTGSGITFIFLQPDVLRTLEPYIIRNLTADQISSIVGSAPINDPFRVGRSGIEAFYDIIIRNIARSRQSGIDAMLRYSRRFSGVSLAFSANGTYRLRSSFQNIAGVPSIDIRNRFGQPANLRIRSGVDIQSDRGWSLGAMVNYTGSYENRLFTPAQTISPWITVDAIARYRFGSEARVLSGTSVSINAQNLFDARPPRVNIPGANVGGIIFNPGFDSANATPYGRIVSVQVTRTW